MFTEDWEIKGQGLENKYEYILTCKIYEVY